ANHPVGAVFAVGIQLRVDTQVMPNLVGEEQRGQQHAGQYAIGEVVGEDHDHHGHYHDDIGGKRVAPQVADRIPAEGADGHHDHHRHQRGHGDLPDPVAEEDHHQQYHHAGDQRRQPRATAGFDVNHRLADHRATGHAAE